MSFKLFLFYVGCTAAWFTLLPVFVIGGCVALLGYAVFTELAELVTGSRKKAVDDLTAREIASRMCLGH